MHLVDGTKPPHLPGVYYLRNRVTGKEYLGSTATSLRRRYNSHLARLRRRFHFNPSLQADYDQYGEAAFEFGIIEQTTPEEATTRELYWATARPAPAGRYNSRLVAERRTETACPHCGAPLGSKQALGQARRFGYCRSCKPRPTPPPTSYPCPVCGRPGLSRQAAMAARSSGRCTRLCRFEPAPAELRGG
jgi:hypothetical protein